MFITIGKYRFSLYQTYLNEEEETHRSINFALIYLRLVNIVFDNKFGLPFWYSVMSN